MRGKQPEYSREQLAALSAAYGSNEPPPDDLKIPDDPGARATYEQYSLALQIGDQVHGHFAAQGLSLAAAAARLGWYERALSNALDGNHDVTLSSLAQVLGTFGLHAEIQITPAVGGIWEQSSAQPPQA